MPLGSQYQEVFVHVWAVLRVGDSFNVVSDDCHDLPGPRFGR